MIAFNFSFKCSTCTFLLIFGFFSTELHFLSKEKQAIYRFGLWLCCRLQLLEMHPGASTLICTKCESRKLIFKGTWRPFQTFKWNPILNKICGLNSENLEIQLTKQVTRKQKKEGYREKRHFEWKRNQIH